MTYSNDHLTGEEALQIVHARACPQQEVTEPRLEDHLRHCQSCTRMVQQYRRFMSRLYEFGKTGQAEGECPDPAIWGEVASGIVAQETATKLLKHAASCQDCVEELLNALEVLGNDEPVPRELQGMLTTATPEWQKRFAANVAARRTVTPPAIQRPTAPSRRGWLVFSRPWIYAAMAALLVLTGGVGLYSWLRGASPENLIRQAYAQQRTVEMRIPGAHYGPIQVQRADGRSQISSPQALLEAEVQIKRGLDKKPEDAELLRQKAETDLLNWNYQPALETLNHASRLKPGSFELLVDTATAYFERAEATASPADYEAGLQALGDAIRLKPDDPAALFNRAILHERLYFYGRAIADWEALLKIEKDSGWRKEAEQRLQEIREREKKRSLWHDPDQVTLSQFKSDVADTNLAGIEEYVAAAERRVLPEGSAVAGNENQQVVAALANTLQTRHSDSFFKELLSAPPNQGFHEAVQLLGESSSANHTGRYEEAFASAVRSASIFHKLGNTAGAIAAQFEQAYALQFESRSSACVAVAQRGAEAAASKNYSLLEVQLLLEQAICSNMRGNLGIAKELTQTALNLAKSHSYMSAYLRGLTLIATLEDQAGDDSSAWLAIQTGLESYWKMGLPAVRAYSLYTALDRMAERIGHANVQFAAAYESVNFGFENPDRNVEASKRARLGDISLRVGEIEVAQKQFERAEQIFAAAPQTESTRWRQLEARIGRARVQLLQGADTRQTASALLASLPEVHRLANRYVEFQYYETLAELTWRLEDSDEAKQFLNEAIRITENGLSSLTTWRERSAWMEQHRSPYLLMTHVLFRDGKEQSALELWERFRSAEPEASVTGVQEMRQTQRRQDRSEGTAGLFPETRILTYALEQHGLMIWVRSAKETHAAFVQPPESLRQTVETFASECSRPDSDLSGLQADAQLLYSWLIRPISQWLPVRGHLIIEPDGILNILSFEALMDRGSTYLGARYAVTTAATVQARFGAYPAESFPSSTRALIVAAPASLNGSFEPPPGAMSEAMHVAEHFHSPLLLAGREAKVATVQKELSRSIIFHFAGHGTLGRNGAALVLADGLLGTNESAIFHANVLSQLRLAVFSACDTAGTGERRDTSGLVSEFLHAGVKNVVASRWNVDSMATTDFMGLVYQAVLSGAGIADSVQSAAGTLRRTAERVHPYYWAAFSAFGSA